MDNVPSRMAITVGMLQVFGGCGAFGDVAWYIPRWAGASAGRSAESAKLVESLAGDSAAAGITIDAEAAAQLAQSLEAARLSSHDTTALVALAVLSAVLAVAYWFAAFSALRSRPGARRIGVIAAVCGMIVALVHFGWSSSIQADDLRLASGGFAWSMGYDVFIVLLIGLWAKLAQTSAGDGPTSGRT